MAQAPMKVTGTGAAVDPVTAREGDHVRHSVTQVGTYR